MKKYLSLLVTISFPFILFSQDDNSKSIWQTEKIVVDGNSNEWKKPFDFYNNKARVIFALANDSNTLYICFLNTERANQMRMLNRGMKISLITKGKKKSNASISFPMGSNKMEHNKLEPGMRPDKIMMRNNFLKNNRSMKTSGFYSNNGIISINNISGLKVAIDWDTNNNMVYEIAVPFIELFGPGYTKSDLLNAFTLQVEIPPLEIPDNKVEGGNGKSEMRNEEGMKTEGGTDRPMRSEGNWQGKTRNEGMNPGNGQNHQQFNEDRSYLYEKSKFKQKFFLSIP